jgi:predicted O-linked N-acetylglucosamine transferase (SPINDLY family)
MIKPGRNDPCPCGSGKKYKHCCQAKDAAQAASARASKAFIPGTLQMAIQQHQVGRLPTAKALYQQILQADPAHADALHLLGLIEHQQGNSTVAVDLIQQAIQARPNDATFHFNLGNMQQDLGHLDPAIACFKQALQRQPGFVDALLGLGTALRAKGLVDEAIASCRQVVAIQPDYAVAYNNLLFVLQSSSTCPPAEIYAEHQRFAERFEAPLKPFWQPHPNPPEPERRLKVGYVSGDFRQHAVAYFIEPILASHDKARFEIYGYCNNTVHDRYTERIASHMDHWLVCRGLSDEQLAQRIRSDGIDILVDLSGHTALNRLLVFARKPAPVQVTWIGYQGSTGLSAIDYRITDAFMDPPGQTERYHSETLVRLPNGGFAYQPEPDCPPVNALPALSSGELVFASLNTLSKINPAVVSLWARILQALPQARLILGNVTDAEIAQRLASQFAQNGIAPERLILKPQMSTADYLALHQRIDIGLDPFPYNGGTTTMHSLWMGVPVITLAGQHAISRFGVSLMSRVGLAGFICQTEDEYVQCAVKFANDLPRLNEVRQSLRARMSAPEWAPANITRHLEAAYRNIWRKWCAQ